MKKITLDNGFRILLERRVHTKSCSMGLYIACGSRFETQAFSGAAHFLEHMVFKGTENRSALDIARQSDELGGLLNAYTTKEYTCFHNKCLPGDVGLSFDIIADMVTSPLLREEDIDTEKNVVLEEIAMYLDSPEDLCFDRLCEGVWPGATLGNSITGTRAAVQALDRAKLDAFRRQQYIPERMVAAFCGSFDPDEAVELAERRFGSLDKGGNPPEISCCEYVPCFVTVKKDFEQLCVSLGFPGVGYDDERHYACSLLTAVLGGNSSSRLFRRLREELGLVYSVDAFDSPFMGCGLAGVTMSMSPSVQHKPLSEALALLRGVADDLKADELQTAAAQAKASVVMGLESASGALHHMAAGEPLRGRVLSQREILRNIDAVGLDTLKRTASEILDFSKLSVCAVGKPDVGFLRKLARGAI